MNRDQIKHMLDTDARWVVRGLLFLHSEQTEDEKASGMTREHNGRGFNGFAAPFASSLVEWINKGRNLSPKQLAGGRKVCVRHIGQLERESERRYQACVVHVRQGSLADLDPFQAH